MAHKFKKTVKRRLFIKEKVSAFDTSNAPEAKKHVFSNQKTRQKFVTWVHEGLLSDSYRAPLGALGAPMGAIMDQAKSTESHS